MASINKPLISLSSSFLLLLLLIIQIHSSMAQPSVVKAIYYFSGSEYPVPDIDSALFTHIFCAFADLNSTTNEVTISPANSAKFSTFTQTVQRKNPCVKTLLSIGGGSSNRSHYASMASNPNSRKSFIDSSIKLARSNNFHGLDLDWEYPSTATEMSNFGTLVTEWRTAAKTEAQNSGKCILLLTAAVFRSDNYYGIQYPVQAVSNGLDFINVMSYDFYGPEWSSNFTAPPAGLFSPTGQANADAGISSWIQAGFQAKKMVFGFPFYGWAWKLVNPSNNGFNAPANGAATGTGIYDGAITYSDIKKFINRTGAIPVYNSTVVSDYVYSGTTWIGYDDTQSITRKVVYAKGKGLLGYFAWQLAADDNWTLSRTASNAWAACYC